LAAPNLFDPLAAAAVDWSLNRSRQAVRQPVRQPGERIGICAVSLIQAPLIIDNDIYYQ
jgi:hypothetical protein